MGRVRQPREHGCVVAEVPSVLVDRALRVGGASAIEGDGTAHRSADYLARIRHRRQIADPDVDNRDICVDISGVIGHRQPN
ncbi:MAG: hypothetical protein ABF309_00355 [Desulfobacterales bacterium]